MRYLSGSEIQVKGYQKLNTKLEKTHPDFQDVKLIAYPVVETDVSLLNAASARITVTPAIEQSDRMFDGDRLSDIRLPQNVDYCIDWKTDRDFTVRSLTIYPSHCNINVTFELQAKIGNKKLPRSSWLDSNTYVVDSCRNWKYYYNLNNPFEGLEFVSREGKIRKVTVMGERPDSIVMEVLKPYYTKKVNILSI